MKHVGDITKLSGYDLPPVDCITGGSPCQDLSVAGKRAGLDGERSGLFMEQIRIIKEMRYRDRREGRSDVLIRPRYMVWENVPGAFSSNGGADFQAVLTEIVRIADPNAPDVPMPNKGKWEKSGCLYDELAGWSVAWRITDAQYWGVPQRRRRLCVLADFSGLTAPWILFDAQLERKAESGEQDNSVGDPSRSVGDRSESVSVAKSLSGNSEQGGTERKGASAGAERGIGESGKSGCDVYNFAVTGDVAATLNANTGQSANHSGPTVLDQSQTAYGISPYDSNAMKSDNPHSGIYEANTSRTLDNNGGSPACNQGGIAIVAAVDCRNGTENPNINGTLQCKENGGSSLNLNNVVRDQR